MAFRRELNHEITRIQRKITYDFHTILLRGKSTERIIGTQRTKVNEAVRIRLVQIGEVSAPNTATARSGVGFGALFWGAFIEQQTAPRYGRPRIYDDRRRSEVTSDFLITGKSDGLKELYPLTVDQMRAGLPGLVGSLDLDDVRHWIQHEVSAEVSDQLVKLVHTVKPT